VSGNIEQRKLAAIMFTDMVGYSALSQRDDKLAPTDRKNTSVPMVSRVYR
jgi:class 3 adenylate cyclase